MTAISPDSNTTNKIAGIHIISQKNFQTDSHTLQLGMAFKYRCSNHQQAINWTHTLMG